jgi:hypothetical protein
MDLTTITQQNFENNNLLIFKLQSSSYAQVYLAASLEGLYKCATELMSKYSKFYNHYKCTVPIPVLPPKESIETLSVSEDIKQSFLNSWKQYEDSVMYYNDQTLKADQIKTWTPNCDSRTTLMLLPMVLRHYFEDYDIEFIDKSYYFS